ncbi:S8 family serine peptidase [Myceligenerans crystallogenes]|uniref:Peptidase S8/S53 domain-containing protein n=1 Tax=Myceligenerans crystallogenes TaxID=316335 RepID=A0ABN2NEL5_9MICO
MRTRATAAAALAVALLTSGGAIPSAFAAPTAPPAAAPRTVAKPVTVTLLTGDRVQVTTAPDGTRSVAVRPAAGRGDIAFFQRTAGERFYVIPADVAGLVGEQLDEALFDVAGLADAGFGNRGTLPVIVQQAEHGTSARSGNASTLASGPGWAEAGVTPARVLESVNAVSDDVDAAAGAKLIDALLEQTGTAGVTTFAAGDAPEIAHVWLDAPVQALDADSAPQIGAPQAWEAGYTGAGVKVAVLDTGIDATHPDLDELVVAKKDFSGTGSVKDGHGHGTHVASIVAGSGEASGGENSGMAPGADLMVGKVLTDDGYGDTSSIIDGMEWAAVNGADVVNMSLGSSRYTDGSDAMSRAVDRLTAEHDTLFVIAAGNDGGDETIGTPGAASSALTVGAVGDDDKLTDFSSRGPRVDGAIKPDVVAPGDGIVAARAAGTTMGEVVGTRYVAASGTSMAAPHVAGAAAVLLEARPKLSAARLKAALMGSAETTGATVFQEGAGRIFLPTAIEQQVLALPGSVSFGMFEYPHDDTVSKTVTYRNTGDTEAVLDLDLAVNGPSGKPATGARLSAEQVTVPARGTAKVTITVDQGPGRIGLYGGTLVATAADGEAVRTVVGWRKQPQLFDLTVKMTGQNGKPFNGLGDHSVLNVNDAGKYAKFGFSEGSAKKFRVPAGRYSVTTTMANSSFTRIVQAYAPEFTVTGPRTITLDARKAMPVSMDTPKPADLNLLTLDTERTDAKGFSMGAGTMLGAETKTFVSPTKPVTVGTFDLVVGGDLSQPTRRGETPAYNYQLAFRQTVVRKGSFVARAEDLARMRTTFHDAARGSVVSAGWAPLATGRTFAMGMLTEAEPGRRVDYVSTRNVRWYQDAWYDRFEDDGDWLTGIYASPLASYAPGSRHATEFAGAPRSPLGTVQQLGDQLAVVPSGWSDAAGHEYWSIDEKNASHITVVQDGETVFDGDAEFAELTTPEAGARYQVSYSSTPGSSWWYTGKKVTGEWTFRAEPVAEEEFATRTLLDVRYDVDGITTRGAAPRRTEIGVKVKGADGASEVRLWWSADNGTTWRSAPLHDGVATVNAPAGTTAVALRAEASDAAGNAVKETVRKAYTIE